MLTAIVLPALNRVLRSNDWALQKLRAHAGKLARIECGPVVAAVEVQPTGELERPLAPGEPHVVIRVLPGAVVRLALRDETAWSEVAIEGDSELATALHQVWQQLDWGLEEDLSRLFGDIVAHRMVTAGHDMRTAAAQAVDGAIRNLAEYWTEERPVVAVRRDIDAYVREVDALRDDVARLEKRVNALQGARSGRFGAEYGHNNTATPDHPGG